MGDYGKVRTRPYLVACIVHSNNSISRVGLLETR